MAQAIQIRTEAGLLALDLKTWRWAPQEDSQGLQDLAAWANAISAAHDYAPAHGQPGYRLARLVAAEIGGEPVLPPLPDYPEDAVF
jgi:hypothetical protein